MSEEIITRAYNTFIVDEENGSIRKNSRTDRLKNEAEYYKALEERYQYSSTQEGAFKYERVKRHFANMRNTDRTYEVETFDTVGTYLDLELYGYENYGTQFARLVESLSPSWITKDHPFDGFMSHLKQVMEILHGFGEQQYNYVHDIDQWIEDARSMFVDKTAREFMALLTSRSDWKGFLLSDPVSINFYGKSRKYRNFLDIWPKVVKYIDEEILTRKLVEKHRTVIHGDMCFSNILYTDTPYKVIKFIDPRGSFGRVGIFGDNRYDIAKLYHSVDGLYEFIIRDQFALAEHAEKGLYMFDVIYPSVDLGAILKLQSAFNDKFVTNLKETMVLSGLIFIGMCARHYDSEQRQKVMYLTGLKQLNEAMEL